MDEDAFRDDSYDDGYQDDEEEFEQHTIHGSFSEIPGIDLNNLTPEAEDALFDFLIETQVKPQLEAAMGEMPEIAEAADNPDDIEDMPMQGEMFIFGQSDGVDPEELLEVQKRLGEGMKLEYALEEFTRLRLKRQRERVHRGIRIRYIELSVDQDGVEALSADELSEMFNRS